MGSSVCIFWTTRYFNFYDERLLFHFYSPGKGMVISCSFNLFIFRLTCKEYTMETYFRQYWKDARLAFPKLNGPVTFSGELPDVLWQPDTYFENGFEGSLHHLTVLNKFLRLHPDGSVLVSTRYGKLIWC